MIAVAKRAETRTTDAARLRIWRVRGSAYLVIEVRGLYVRSLRYLAVEQLANGNQRIISRHRKRSAAVQAVRYAAEAALCAR